MDKVIDWCILRVIWKLSTYGSKLRNILSMWIANSQISKVVDTGIVIILLL